MGSTHYGDVAMGAITSQITSVSIVFSTVCLCTDKKKSKPRVTGLCAGNSPGTGEFPAQKASNAENVSIWWRHHVYLYGFLSRVSAGITGTCNHPSAERQPPVSWKKNNTSDIKPPRHHPKKLRNIFHTMWNEYIKCSKLEKFSST